MKLTKQQREIVKQKFGGKCAYCGCELPEKGWHADHVIPCQRVLEVVPKNERKNPNMFEMKHSGEYWNDDANNIENMYPACAPCNLYKATYSLEQFRKQVQQQTDRARLSSVNFRTAERFGLLVVNNNPVVFWFERYNEVPTV